MSNIMSTLNQPAIADQEYAVLSEAETDEVSRGFIIAVAAVIAVGEIAVALPARPFCQRCPPYRIILERMGRVLASGQGRGLIRTAKVSRRRHE